ncbi:MAG: SDR family NAD(P)-dependent oxidoreductase [Microbacterium sp.]|uniref:SDR family NAD(P)-dependent oxidoreductase n=1 Tax=Microbacterium sp. TaxID=51671 RepID=UPI003F7D124C
MTSDRNVVIIGGTSGIGLALAQRLVAEGSHVVITGRDRERAQQVAEGIGENAVGIGLDLAKPDSIAESLAFVERVDGLVLSGVERDNNTAREFDKDRASRLATIKLIGYLETIHVLADRIPATVDSGIVIMGGIARYRPYPGSLTVSTVNGGVEGMVTALALELAPIRVNALHPGIIGDTPFWAGKEPALAQYRSRTPGGELATAQDVVDATLFLLHNRGVSAAFLHVDRATLAS